MILKNKRAVIFDLDGTLIDSNGIWKSIDERFMKDNGFEDPGNIQELIGGKTMDETAKWFFENYYIGKTPDELVEIWNDMAYEEYRYNISLKPGAFEFLEYCKNNNIKMAIATSNSKELVMAAFEQHSLNKYIDIVVSSRDVLHGKPAPDVYLEALNQLGVSASETIAFEDIPQGIMAAKAANLYTVCMHDIYSDQLYDEKYELCDKYIHSYLEMI